MTRQQIRLKEFDHNITKVHVPTDAYLMNAPLLDKDRAYYQQTDENGFIETGNYFDAEYAIAVVGDSFVENIFVDESSRFESVLERKFLASGRRVKVINAGVSGMTGLSAFNLILNKIVKIKPNIIIFIEPSNDFSALLYKDGYFNDSKLHSNLVPPRNRQSQIYETINENKRQISNNIVLLNKVCELYDIKLVIATCASNSSKRQLAMMNNIIREESAKLNFLMVDLDNILIKSNKFYYDKCHLNESGSSYLADVIFNFLKDNRCLKNISKNDINFSEQVFDLSFESDELIKIDLGSGKCDNVESWISITTIPKELNVSYFLEELSICLCNGFKYYKLSTVGASNKILEKTLPLNNCDPGVYTVKFENIDELPFVVNNIRLFKVIGN